MTHAHSKSEYKRLVAQGADVERPDKRSCKRCSLYCALSNTHGKCKRTGCPTWPNNFVCADGIDGWDVDWVDDGVIAWECDEFGWVQTSGIGWLLDCDGDWQLRLDGKYRGLVAADTGEFYALPDGQSGTVCRGTLHDCARALVEKVRNNG